MKGKTVMRLTSPKKIVFYISVVAMLVGLVFYLFFDDMKDLGYWVTFAGGALLTAGVAMKGI
jgi:hypothetical protein